MADINNIPALMLANSGKEELTVDELTNPGYYWSQMFLTTSRNWLRTVFSNGSARRTTGGLFGFAFLKWALNSAA